MHNYAPSHRSYCVNQTTNADKTTICLFELFSSILYFGKTFNSSLTRPTGNLVKLSKKDHPFQLAYMKSEQKSDHSFLAGKSGINVSTAQENVHIRSAESEARAVNHIKTGKKRWHQALQRMVVISEHNG